MLFRHSDKLEEGVISLLLVAITLLVFVEVIARFGFGKGFIWVEELTLLMSGWFVLFGASYGIKTGAHIGVDAVVRLFPEWGQRLAALISVALGLVYSGLFLVGGWVYLEKVYSIHIEMADLPVPKWVAHSIIIPGFALFAIRLVDLGRRLWKRELAGFNITDEERILAEVRHLHAGEDEETP